MKRPAFQFYPADWRKDPALSACSLASRGLWIEIMCIAHEAENYGVLSINGKTMTEPQIARMVGEQVKTVSKLLKELEAAGVFSRNELGAIFSRRMVKDEQIRTVRSEAGRLGGNPNLVGDLLKQTDKQSPTPSSSTSVGTPSSLRSEGVAHPKPTKLKQFDPIAYLLEQGVDRQIAEDWLQVRKAKRLVPTQTAFAGLELEAAKAGISVAAAVERACRNGWGGFKATWADEGQQGTGGKPNGHATDRAARIAAFTGPGRAEEHVIEGTAERVA